MIAQSTRPHITKAKFTLGKNPPLKWVFGHVLNLGFRIIFKQHVSYKFKEKCVAKLVN